MLRLLRQNERDERYATTDRVILSDGQVVEVPRANLAAAKALLAAERAAKRCRAGEIAACHELPLAEYPEQLLSTGMR